MTPCVVVLWVALCVRGRRSHTFLPLDLNMGETQDTCSLEIQQDLGKFDEGQVKFCLPGLEIVSVNVTSALRHQRCVVSVTSSTLRRPTIQLVLAQPLCL